MSQRSCFRAIAILTVACLPAMATAAAPPADQRVRVALHEVLFHGDAQEPGSPSLLIELTRRDGVWLWGWGTAGNYDKNEHAVRVDRAAMGDKALELALTVNVRGGGRITVQATLARQPDGRFSGRYRGTSQGVAVEGIADAEVLPALPVHRPAAAVGEHPRLLLRGGDLQDLKRKAATPFGRAALAALPDNAAGLAVRYALTDDAKQAAEARQRVAAMMTDEDNGDKRVRSRWWAWRAEQAAIAYDLCHDAWDADFRRQVEEYLLRVADIMLYDKGRMDSHINWNYSASHAPTMMWAAGVAALAVGDVKGPAPQRPQPPAALELDGPLPPVEMKALAKGTPEVRFASGKLIADWLYAGAFPEADDPLATDALRGRVQPAPATAWAAATANGSGRRWTRRRPCTTVATPAVAPRSS